MSMSINYRKITLFIKDLNEKQILLILLGIAFGLRLYAVLMAKGIAYDGAGYGFVARDFLRHDFVKGDHWLAVISGFSPVISALSIRSRNAV